MIPFTISPLIDGERAPEAHYILRGQPEQLGVMYLALRQHGFPVIMYGGHPSFARENEVDLIAALGFLFTHKIDGWEHQKEKMLKYKICTAAEYRRTASKA